MTRLSALILVLLATIPLTGCELVGNIFQAGVWVGVILVVLVIAIIGLAVSRARG